MDSLAIDKKLFVELLEDIEPMDMWNVRNRLGKLFYLIYYFFEGFDTRGKLIALQF